MLVSNWHVAHPATPSGDPTWVGWGRTSARTHLIVIPAGGRHGSPSPSARGHSVKRAVSTAGPTPTYWEPSHKPATASPLFKHHGETTVFICFIVEVRVIGLCSALYGSLKGRTEGDNLTCWGAFKICSLQEYLCAGDKGASTTNNTIFWMYNKISDQLQHGYLCLSIWFSYARLHFKFPTNKIYSIRKMYQLMDSIRCNSNYYKGHSTTVKDTHFSNELQHSLDTLHHPLCFTTNQHHPVCRLRTTLLKQLDAGLCVL